MEVSRSSKQLATTSAHSVSSNLQTTRNTRSITRVNCTCTTLREECLILYLLLLNNSKWKRNKLLNNKRRLLLLPRVLSSKMVISSALPATNPLLLKTPLRLTLSLRSTRKLKSFMNKRSRIILMPLQQLLSPSNLLSPPIRIKLFACSVIRNQLILRKT